MQYNPNPTRVWSRVQSRCPTDSESSALVYVPLTNNTVPQAEANYQEKVLYKGNILQYKNNSSRITKKQKYSQISKGLWCNRQKSYATQSQTYTNPNTTSLKRVNYIEIPFPNQIVGSPNNISGPYQYQVPNPFNCSANNVLQDGGNLVCNAYVDPCTNKIIQKVYEQECYPTYCSDVPGTVQYLCWNPKLDTWFPKQRYVMNNSLNKWPLNYKGLISAVKPSSPVLKLESSTSTSVTLSWLNNNSKNCLPISQYIIYQNGLQIQTVSFTILTTTISITTPGTYSFYVVALSRTIKSEPSNIISITV